MRSSSDSGARAPWLRSLVFFHRWLGLLLGPLVILWCISGGVMMYVAFPEVTEAERLSGLSPLGQGTWPFPSPSGWSVALEGNTDALAERLELASGSRLVVRTRRDGKDGKDGKAQIHDYQTGELLGRFDHADLVSIAQSFQRNRNRPDRVVESLSVDRDQWTVTGRFDPHRPLLKVAFAGADDEGGQGQGDGSNGSEFLYVSPSTGEVVQQVTAPERFWNAPGAVTHWLYITSLRSHARVWTQVVIWTSILTLFLLSAGAVLGIRALRWKNLRSPSVKPGRLSPYRGVMRWHHLTSATCGLLLLTWTLSGLLSMNPWGLLENSSNQEQRERLRWLPASGVAPEPPPLSQILSAPLARETAADAVALRVAPFAGKLAALLVASDGSTTRFDETGSASPLPPETLERAVSTMQPDAKPRDIVRLHQADSYYYSHHSQRRFPVLRVIMNDRQRTRHYLDPSSGQLLHSVDRSGRWYRWLHNGLHRFDFTAALRARPLWDVLVLLGLALCTFAAGTGLYAGLKHLRKRLAS